MSITLPAGAQAMLAVLLGRHEHLDEWSREHPDEAIRIAGEVWAQHQADCAETLRRRLEMAARRAA